MHRGFKNKAHGCSTPLTNQKYEIQSFILSVIFQGQEEMIYGNNKKVTKKRKKIKLQTNDVLLYIILPLKLRDEKIPQYIPQYIHDNSPKRSAKDLIYFTSS